MPERDLTEEFKPPSIYFENRTSKYWLEDANGRFRAYTSSNAKAMLRRLGVSKDNDEIRAMLEASLDASFDFPLAISGHKRGLHEINGKLVLVPDEPKLFEPKAGDWPIVKTIWESALGEEQFEWFYWWLASTLQGLHNGVWVPAPVVAFIGETGSCKSLTQSILTKLLGDREARVIQAITGGTGFNGDWAEATHLVVEDDFSDNSKKIRQRIKESIKSVAVNERHRIHPKGTQAFTICPFWRMTISCNPVGESLAVLPEMDNTVDKKLALLWFSRATMPMPSDSAQDRKKLWNAIMEELPALVHEMIHAGAVPEHLRDSEARCTVNAYHHSESLSAVAALSPDGEWLSKFCEYVSTPWEGTAAEAERALRDAGAPYPKGSTEIGYILTRLSVTHPREVSELGRVTGNKKQYRIAPDWGNSG